MRKSLLYLTEAKLSLNDDLSSSCISITIMADYYRSASVRDTFVINLVLAILKADILMLGLGFMVAPAANPMDVRK